MANSRGSRAKGGTKPPVAYILTLNNGATRTLRVPFEYRITYGAAGRDGGPAQFRVYNGTKLIVVWRDVKHITLDGLDIIEGVSPERVIEKISADDLMYGMGKDYGPVTSTKAQL